MTDRRVGPRDAGRRVELSPGDRLVVTLPEIPGSGYIWEIEALPPGARVVDEDREEPAGVGVGGETLHAFVVEIPASGRVRARRGRPWLGESGVVERFDLDVSVSH